MKTISARSFAALALTFLLFAVPGSAKETSRKLPPPPVEKPAAPRTDFEAGWLFFKGDPPGAAQNSCDDSAWRKVDLPHDWSIEGPFTETNKTGGAGAFLPAGVAWYRKHFSR